VHDGFLISDTSLMAHNYVTTPSMFLLDLISSFPFALIFGAIFPDDGATNELVQLNRLLRLTRVAKLTRMLKLIHVFHFFQKVYRFNPGLFRLMGLLLVLLWASHTTGCAWYFVLSQGALEDYAKSRCLDATDFGLVAEENCDETGRERYPLDHIITSESVGRKYLFCVSWALGLLTGVVPTDIYPTQTEEVIFDVACLLIGIVLNSLILSSTVSVIASLDNIAHHH